MNSPDYVRRIQKGLHKDPGTVNFAYPSTSMWSSIDEETVLTAWKKVPLYANDPNFIMGLSPATESSAERIRITIYLGIEGCPTRCSFCGYGAAALGSDEVIERSVQGIVQDGRRFKDAVDCSKFEVGSMFIGGGTPNMLSPEQLEKVLRALEFLPKQPGYELGTEIYPQKILQHKTLSPRYTQEFLQAFKQLGGTRVSWAVQDFSNEALQASGRRYTIEEALEVYHSLFGLQFQDVNIDLLIGTKGHKDVGIEQMLQGIDLLAQSKERPSRVTPNILSLSYEKIPDRRLMLQDQTLVGFEQQFKWYLEMNGLLTTLGYPQINRFDYGSMPQYEIDVVSSRPRLVFGTGALGYVPTATGGLEYKNPTVGDSRGHRGFMLSKDLAVARAIHNDIFKGEIDVEKVHDLAKGIVGFELRWNIVLGALQETNLIRVNGKNIALTVEGKYHHATIQNLLSEAVLGYENDIGKRIVQ